MSARLISIIGPPASGKTTLAEGLAEALPARLVREDYAGNPFLTDSYLGRREFALPSQLYFLFSRLSQLNLQTWPADGIVVTDYGFCQDAVYAAASLGDEDLATYRRLSAGADGMVTAPDLLICLDGPEQELLDRIARRGRRHETAFTPSFLAALRRAYERIVSETSGAVLRIDAAAIDLRRDADRREITRRVREAME